MAKLRITYKRSSIGFSKDQKATITSLGLRKLNSSVIHNDTPAVRGMAFKVQHLVVVEELDDAAAADAATKPVKRTVRPTVVAQAATSATVSLAAPVAVPLDQAATTSGAPEA